MDEEKLEDLSFRRLGITSPAVKGSYQKYHQKLHKFLSKETRMFIRSQQKYMNALRQLEQAPQMILALNASSNSSNSQEARDSEAIMNECYPPKAWVGGSCIAKPVLNHQPLECYVNKRSKKCEKILSDYETKLKEYWKALRQHYPYMYDTGLDHTANQNNRYLITPVRFPHKDMSNLGDNYIVGMTEGNRDFSDRITKVENVGQAPIPLQIFAGGTGDKSYSHSSRFVSDSASLGPFRRSLVPFNELKNQWHPSNTPQIPPHDRFSPLEKKQGNSSSTSNKAEQVFLLGKLSGNVDPLGINSGLQDDEVPASRLKRSWR
ncbi:hypothetical protein GUITHDRAFT_153524 [Guillardia theta CCMP2712]|uniref:Uncharacterized protein n=1 Tax=Guillardia theta (strain CCMP2712) TaxID=905079 RepID=L1J2R8_GUITC|nr:hypothetical protein GUITHDRAFT_153524 [Guillardia theta CCMP2712]EKX42434.1 hypothetical protein GUITHDRAFT_153524 [Guillardia theta CCMP2712]|eukprot:XP_005829414.1 hypothetical protein GUITHDRAFT_153524 [Guillardia theta CCMP2712]